MKYKIVITDLAGTELGEITQFNGLTYTHVLNREGDCQFEISLTDPNYDLLAIGSREIYIYRDTTLAWAGSLTLANGTFGGKNETVTIYAKGFFDLFRYRFTGASRIFSATDAGTIAWTLIDESQALTDGDYGIDQGTIDTSVDRDRTYEYKNVYEAIVQLSEVLYGFDFDVTDTKEFNVHYPQKGADKSDNVIFDISKNLESIDFVQDFSEPANSIILLGAGNGSAMPVVTRTDTNMRSQYKLRQLINAQKDVSETATLESIGDKQLRTTAYVIRQYKVSQVPNTEPYYGELVTGDWVRVRANHGYLQIEDIVRIKTIQVDVDAGGKESIKYLFDYE